MSYTVLARKWRPRTFSNLIGQDSLVKALSCSLDKQRLHHAYLFTGTRGVGKTSVARIFAKALNCEKGISSTPCLECDACLSIEQGRFIDLLEIDGASRTRVEDTRELLDNVMYAPTSGRFKIYLIDEVHMLSQHSFNTLLKTLEEPPAHVKFILATTDPQKLPLTVLSRCLQFNLKHIDAGQITTHLETILAAEAYTYDLAALKLLAKAAQGSMRDALSLLDQALAGSDSHLHAHHVKDMLGFTQNDYALDLLNALANNQPDNLIAISQQIMQDGGYYNYVLDDLLAKLHQLCLIQQLSHNHSRLEINEFPELIPLSTQLLPEDLQLFYQIALNAREDILRAPTMDIGFEMTLLRMHAFKPTETIVIPPEKKTILIEPPVQSNEKNQNIQTEWVNILPQLKLQGLALNAIENAEFYTKDDHCLTLKINKGHQSLFTPTTTQRIEQALTQYYNTKIRLDLKYDDLAVVDSPAQQKKIKQLKQQQQDEQTLQEDPVFQQLKNAFSIETVYNIQES
jgi:DNA polymerase III subunit gamma/tau